MSLLEDVFKGGNLLTGIGIAIGAALIAPAVMPILKPVAKSVIKAGLVAYDQGRVAFAEVNEPGGIVAEVRSEMRQHPEERGSSQAMDEVERATGHRSRG